MGLCVLLFFMSISSSILPFGTIQGIIIMPGKHISANHPIISANGTFALGFLSLGNSTPRYYLGIWYHKIQKQTVVWVANRESPTNSLGVFAIGEDGNLVVLEETGKIVWSSNVKVADSAINNTIGELMDNGNLVLGSREAILWQSFDHPSDTLLPGMKLGYNLKTGQQRQLQSWIGPEDPRAGNFTFGLEPMRPLQFFIWKEHDAYTRSELYSNGFSFAKLSELMRPHGFSITLNFEGGEIYVAYSAIADPATIRLKLAPNGRTDMLIWKEEHKRWFSMWQWPKTYCDFYSQCSAFSICDRKGSPDYCKCLTGFQPKVQQEWDRRDWTSGCVRQKELKCDEDDGFLKFVNMKFPDHSYLLGNMSAKYCESRCLKNCSCTAYAYLKSTEGSSGKCLHWYGDLMDLAPDYSAPDLYIRIHGRELVGKNGKNKLSIRIAAAVVSIGLLSIVSGYFFWRKSFGRQGRTEGLLAGINNRIGGGRGNDGIELDIFRFKRIMAATNDFSEENKLGEGGYGDVYKGILVNQEVAIKRLSKKSRQGLEEFMNELKIIAKLQHTNLVRLLGCCVERKEKILVYEYLPNRSLDKILFDPSKKANLDWHKRFRIIEGIAQGLLYIHKYSRLKVIHRDLKASNILLDEAMNPKISDFGLARMFGSDQTEAETERVVGTLGYMSPEYAQYGIFSEKSDIFSFGVLLVEIVTGKRNADFFHAEFPLTVQGWAWELWTKDRGPELIDPWIRDACEYPERALKCIHVGLLCVQESPADRPKMSSVVQMLINDNASIPSPKEPAFSCISRRRSSNVASSSHTSSLCSNNDLTISLPEAR